MILHGNIILIYATVYRNVLIIFNSPPLTQPLALGYWHLQCVAFCFLIRVHRSLGENNVRYMETENFALPLLREKIKFFGSLFQTPAPTFDPHIEVNLT